MGLQTYTLIPSFTCATQFAQMVWHWQFDDAGFTTKKTAAEALEAAWVSLGRRATLLSILPVDTFILSLKSSCVSAPGGFEAFNSMPANTHGIRTGQTSVSGLAPVLIHYPANLKIGRGRSFLPGISETDVADGIYIAGYRAAVLSALSSLFDPMVLTGGGGPTATFGMWCGKKGAKHFVAATNTLLSENVGTMKRRMRPA